MADSTYKPKVYRKQGGDVLVVASGGAISVESGGSFTYNGAPVTGGSVVADDITGSDLSLAIVGQAGATNAVGGAVPISGGAGNGAFAGGAVSLSGGVGGAAGAGGAASVVGGAPVSGNAVGGAAAVIGGAGGGSGTGGKATLAGGASAGASGTAGSVSIHAGAVAGGTGGSTVIYKGDGTTKRIEVNETGIGFFAASPVAQQAGTGNVTGFAAGVGTTAKSDSVYAGASGTTAYTVGDLVTALKNLGLLSA